MIKTFGFQNAALSVVGSLPMIGMTVSMFVDPPADPYERIAHTTGEFSLRFLLLTMLVTPLVTVSGWKRLIRFRRTLGVITFAYVMVHALAYMVFEAGFSPAFVAEDVLDRNFIAVGMIAFLMMLPLGITSNNLSVRKLGSKWRKLHRLAYPIALLAPLHYLMLKRDEDLTEPIVYLVLFSALLAFRLGHRVYRVRKAAPAAGGT